MNEFLDNHPGIIMGAALIIAGVVAYLFPERITTINGMSPEKRKNVDLHRMGRHVMVGLLLIGAISIGLDFVVDSTIATVLRIIIIFVGVIITVATAQRYDHNK